MDGTSRLDTRGGNGRMTRPETDSLLRLLAAFVLIPLIELYLLLRIADATGVLATIALVIATGVLGSYLARREGVSAWRRFREAMASGRMPGQEIQDGLMIVFAAALLLTPGILTDVLGFTMLTPPGRRIIARHVVPRLIGGLRLRVVSLGDPPTGDRTASQSGFGGTSAATGRGGGPHDRVIDVEAVRSSRREIPSG